MFDDEKRDLLAEVIARGEAIAEEYNMTALTHRNLKDRGAGGLHGQTARAFDAKAEGAWAVVYAARQIAEASDD